MPLLYIFLFILTLATAFPLKSTPDKVANATKSASAVPFGAVIDHCSVPDTVALTFDDGPYMFTPELLDVLSANSAPSTFFMNGGGLGGIYNYREVVQRIWNEGHQVGSHTWSHVSMAGLDYPTIISQMTRLENAFIDIIGGFPVYMRPPYLHADGTVLQAMGDMGYHVISASIDTKDYENDSPDLVWRSLDKFRAGLDGAGSIVLAHDVHQQTVLQLVQDMLEEVRARGLTPVTVGECLGDARDQWYRASR